MKCFKHNAMRKLKPLFNSTQLCAKEIGDINSKIVQCIAGTLPEIGEYSVQHKLTTTTDRDRI